MTSIDITGFSRNAFGMRIAKQLKTIYTTLMLNSLPPRVPWPDDFPNVIVHGEEKARDAHPSYLKAKAGSADAAIGLAFDLMDERKASLIRDICKSTSALLLPIVADEALGYNAIPDGMTGYLELLMGIPTANGMIVQSNKVSHTRAPAFQRIVTPASFEGPVVKGQAYFLIDDHCGFGGTFANLIGHIYSNGGFVVGCTTLTASPNSAKLAVSKLTLDVIYSKHGDEIDDLWIEKFGHGITCLTEREAIVVSRQHSLIALETILAQATTEVRARGI
jgi:hypothetical protein